MKLREELFLSSYRMPLMFSHSLLKGVLVMLGTLIWAVVIILVVLWLLGWLVLHVGGGLIHILIVVAIIVLLFNLFVGRRRRRL
jgi:hypothetical protein